MKPRVRGESSNNSATGTVIHCGIDFKSKLFITDIIHWTTDELFQAENIMPSTLHSNRTNCRRNRVKPADLLSLSFHSIEMIDGNGRPTEVVLCRIYKRDPRAYWIEATRLPSRHSLSFALSNLKHTVETAAAGNKLMTRSLMAQWHSCVPTKPKFYGPVFDSRFGCWSCIDLVSFPLRWRSLGYQDRFRNCHWFFYMR